MEKVRFGIIGLGNMGSGHVNFINQLPQCELTAVCDWKEEKLKHPGLGDNVKRYTDDDEFFADADFDALLVAVPHYQHVELALRAMALGKHVLIEKPVSVQKKTALQLLDAVKKYPDLKLGAMFNQRTIPAHIKVKSMIDSGELGTIRRVNWIITNWFRTQAYYDSGDWRASWRGEGGGVLLNQCPHQLDLMQWFFGLPERVTSIISIGKYHNIEVEDDVTAMLEYPSGATGVFI
ncbi:MAG: Gfo/Idh/MocA family oxidoreductase, partial [Lentisphaeria bacterium]|nr:Gfo/Idh/MocA family oxidoreductase [Lentisphaeria bacterium]